MIRIEPKLGKRTIAALIDYTIFFTFFFWYVMTFGSPNEEGGYSVHGVKSLGDLAFWFAYLPLAETIFGKTLGKYIVGLAVFTKSGGPISLMQAIKRRLLDPFDFFFFGLVAIIAVKNTPDHQRLGDLWAKTIVLGDDPIDCPNCRERLVLSVQEIRSKEFVCPACKEKSKLYIQFVNG